MGVVSGFIIIPGNTFHSEGSDSAYSFSGSLGKESATRKYFRYMKNTTQLKARSNCTGENSKKSMFKRMCSYWNSVKVLLNLPILKLPESLNCRPARCIFVNICSQKLGLSPSSCLDIYIYVWFMSKHCQVLKFHFVILINECGCLYDCAT